MKTSQEWWSIVKEDSTKFSEWLKKQYHGELTAEKRIRDSIKTYGLTGLEARIIESIADDERRHASWIAAALVSHGLTPRILQKEERYWNEVLPALEEEGFKYFCAVGHLAEDMRLERIRVIMNDDSHAMQGIFKRIYADEIFHARMFGLLSDKETIQRAKKKHDIGRNAIGLFP